MESVYENINIASGYLAKFTESGYLEDLDMFIKFIIERKISIKNFVLEENVFKKILERMPKNQ